MAISELWQSAQLLQQMQDGGKIFIYKKYKWNWNMRSFANETLNVFFRKFWTSQILDLAKTVPVLRILSQKYSWNFRMKELWVLENWRNEVYNGGFAPKFSVSMLSMSQCYIHANFMRRHFTTRNFVLYRFYIFTYVPKVIP